MDEDKPFLQLPRKTYVDKEKVSEKMQPPDDPSEAVITNLKKLGIKSTKETLAEQLDKLNFYSLVEHATFNYSSSPSSSESDSKTSDGEELKNQPTLQYPNDKEDNEQTREGAENSEEEESDDGIVFIQELDAEAQNSFTSRNSCNIEGYNSLLDGKFYDLKMISEGADGIRSNFEAIQLYRNGEDDKAIHKFKWAAKYCGNIPAYFNLGICFQEKNDIQKAQREYGIILMKEKDEEMDKKAVKYLQLAVEQRCSESMYILGGCYERGIGVPKDVIEAGNLYRQAGASGHPAALHSLEVLCRRGFGDNAAAVVKRSAEVQTHSAESITVREKPNSQNYPIESLTQWRGSEIDCDVDG